MPEIQTPTQLFTYKLGTALTMEQTVLQMLHTLERHAQEPGLKEQFSYHRMETERQLANLQQAFAAVGERAESRPCPTIDGLKQASEKLISQASDELVDAVVLGGAAETEHHEIAVYEGLIAQAEAMDQGDVAALLIENLEQEQRTLKQVEAATAKQAAQLAELAAA